MYEPGDDQYVDQSIIAARAGVKRVSELVEEGDLASALAVFRSTREEHLRSVADALPVQLVENYATIGGRLAQRLQLDPSLAGASAEVLDAVAKAYDWLARNEPRNATHRTFAAVARQRAQIAMRAQAQPAARGLTGD